MNIQNETLVNGIGGGGGYIAIKRTRSGGVQDMFGGDSTGSDGDTGTSITSP